MSQALLRSGFAASIAIAACGINLPAQASSSLLEDERRTVHVPAARRAAVFASVADIGSDEQLQVASQPSRSSTKVGSSRIADDRQQDDAIATIYAHEMDGLPAATVYVRSIPTFTFLGSKDTEASEVPQADAIVASGDDLDISDPAVRATVLAAQINQYYLGGGTAEDITVRWDDESEELLVEAGTAWTLSMDETIIFPETTGQLTEDALHATNMLRRQLGDAAALSEVEGLPERQVTTVARASFSGMASWYGPGFHGRMSASGERFNQHAMTAAHRTLPFGTLVRVTNLNNGVSAVVRINDRGPFSGGRVIDLSAAAARSIGMIGSGVAPVSVDVLE